MLLIIEKKNIFTYQSYYIKVKCVIILTIAVTWTYESPVSCVGQAPRGISKIVAGTVVASVPRVLTDSGKSIAAFDSLMNIVGRVLDKRKA